MKVVIGTLAIIVLLVGAQSAFALQLNDAPPSKHQMADIISGLAHGIQDAKDNCVHPDGCHWWILMRGNGFINQTQEFIRGYVHGFCSDPIHAGGGGSDAEQADIRCDKGPEAASWETDKILDEAFWTPN